MTDFRWGFLGTGKIAVMMAEALELVPGAVKAAVASRRQDTADAFAASHGFARAHGSYGALYADPKVDIVYVATPNTSHKENILDALAAGKHVLCEKPMTLSEADSAECFAAAEAAGLFLMEALWTAFFPAMQKAIELVQSGAIGQPRHLTANFVAYRDPEVYPILFDPALGGGARNDLGIYPVAAALMLAGPARAASLQSVMGATGVDEMTAMVMEHDNGAVSLLSCGFTVDMPVAARLIGDLGEIEIPETLNHPQRVILRKPGSEEVFDLPSLGFGYAHEAIAVQECLSGDPSAVEAWGKVQTLACARLLQAG